MIGAPVWALLNVAARSVRVMLEDCVPPDKVVCDSVTTKPWVLPRPLVMVTATLAPWAPVTILPLASTEVPPALLNNTWLDGAAVAPVKPEIAPVTLVLALPLAKAWVALPARDVTVVVVEVLPMVLTEASLVPMLLVWP